MKQIKNYPNYLISLDGKVFSLNKMIFLKESTTHCGYKQVSIRNDNCIKTFTIHRLNAMLVGQNRNSTNLRYA